MPFVNESQRRACWAKYTQDKKSGITPKWNCKEWEKHSKTSKPTKTSRRKHETGSRRKTSKRKHKSSSRRKTSRRKHKSSSRRKTSRRKHKSGSRRKTSRRKHKSGSRRKTSRRKHKSGSRRKTSRRKHKSSSRRKTSRRKHKSDSRRKTSRKKDRGGATGFAPTGTKVHPTDIHTRRTAKGGLARKRTRSRSKIERLFRELGNAIFGAGKRGKSTVVPFTNRV